MSYAELCTTSNFTFLTGASHPEEWVERATELGLEAIAITDRNTLAGVVRAYTALKQLREQEEEEKTGLVLPRLIVGARLVLADSDVSWIALPRERAAYGRLCRLLSLGKQRVGKGECELFTADLEVWGEGMFLLALPDDPLAPPEAGIAAMATRFPGQVFTIAAPVYDGRDDRRFARLARCAEAAGAPLVAAGNGIMHSGQRRRLADVLTCLREGCTIDTIGRRAQPHAERRLRSGEDMARLFADYPDAMARSVEIAAQCRFCLSELRYEYPDEVSAGEDAQTRLERLTEQGLAWRFPRGVPVDVQRNTDKELRLIAKLDYARYFLTVRDIVDFARGRDILCQGRGSAANSVVCYALGITEADPTLISAVFERFISEARKEPPDIDVDFEHERREEVIQHLYERYGRDRAGLCATVIHFRSRAALREVGKVMGLSQDVLGALASQVWGWSSSGLPDERVRELGLNPDDKRLRQTLDLVREIIGFPRHLSQHVGGFIITRDRLDEYVPIENAAMKDRTVIEWDKEDIESLGMLKVDVLSLGMLTCMRKAFDLIAGHGGLRYTLDTMPKEDPAVYAMLQTGDSLGVFQVESRAQMAFLPRMKPACFYDLVIEVAIVRPGPIQGDMVHPYLRRRNKEEKPDYPKPELEAILKKTLGVPLFQEQAMQIAMVAACFTANEADGLRRAMATFRRAGTIQNYRDMFIGRMVERGYLPEFAERCFRQIEGFGEYGFPESHAASFALLVYASAWVKCHYPAVFACALLNSQPMGFYAPAQIVRDARDHGVEVLPVCINASQWDNTLEPRRLPDGPGRDGQWALRLGFRQIKGAKFDNEIEWLLAARGNGYRDVQSVWRRAGLAPRILSRLAEADCFASLGLNRRQALWETKALSNRRLPLFDREMDGEGIVEPAAILPDLSRGEDVVDDYRTMRLSLKAHPLSLLRTHLGSRTRRAVEQEEAGNHHRFTLAGLVIARQRPGTASGVVFITLEDETGVANIIVWPKVYERFRRAVIAGRLLRITGRLQSQDGVTHLIASEIEDLSAALDRLGEPDERAAGDGPLKAEALPKPRPVVRARHPREQAKILFPSRDFH